MNIRNTLLTALAAVALTATGAHAQEILANSSGVGQNGFNASTPYSDGDLILAFMSAADVGVNGNVLFDLGSASSFTGLAAGTYSVAGFNGSATAGQGALGFGTADLTASETVPSANVLWSVMGSETNSTKQLWLTSSTNSQPRQSASTQSTTAGIINGIGFAGVGGANPDGSGFDSAQTAGSYLLNTGAFQNFNVGAIAVVGTSNTLNLYSLLPGTGSGGSSTKLGFFTLTDTSGVFSLSFTAIPEPSTYAAILGALTIGFVLVRRRFGASRLNALA